MPRSPALLDDRTPLDGSHVDLAPRIGWLLRMSRVAAGVPLRAMATDLRSAGMQTSTTALSRIEAEGQRHGRVIDAYERRLGLPRGRLRAAVDVLCRTFDHAPADDDPDDGPATLDDFSAIVAAVRGEQPTGGDWLAFAREHGSLHGFGLPAGRVEPLAARLAGELSRSVGTAYTTRYEALAELRCGPYADLVAGVVRESVEAPDTQVMLDLMSAVSELPTRPLLLWAADLLSHERLVVMRGAALMVENMRSIGTLEPAAWLDVVPGFLAAYATADQRRRTVLTRVFKNLPPRARAAIRAGLTAPLEHVPGPVNWTRTRRNRHFAVSSALAARVTEDLGLPEQPMLARLLFEVLFDFRSTRAATSGFLLLASPFADALHPVLRETALTAADAAIRDSARDALTMLQTGDLVPDVSPWVDATDPDLIRTAAVLLGQAGLPMPEQLLTAGLAADETCVRQILYSAGMSRDPRLATIADDPAQPSAVRAGAAWWIRQGGRVTV